MGYSYTIWPGSASFFPNTEQTPFGFYDDDSNFQCDIEKAANWAARKLGYPNVDVELHPDQFFSAYEEAVNEYGYILNNSRAEDDILSLMGMETGSINITQEYVEANARPILKLASEYATAAGVGGTLTHYSASLTLRPNKQVYDLRTDPSMSLETGSLSSGNYIIRRIYHNEAPASVRFFDPYVSTGLSSQRLLEEFSWGGYSPGVSFVLMPLHYDALRLQAIELNDMIRKSAYTFELTNDRLRIFPIPTESKKLWFTYTLGNDYLSNHNANLGRISDHSNLPFNKVNYSRLNTLSINWIRNYFFALCKEMLGKIRGKFQTIPIPGNEISLNYDGLVSEAIEEKQSLREDLREKLKNLSKKSSLERKAEEANAMLEYLKFIPMKPKRG